MVHYTKNLSIVTPIITLVVHNNKGIHSMVLLQGLTRLFTLQPFVIIKQKERVKVFSTLYKKKIKFENKWSPKQKT